ncbi:MAG: O-antigen ligase family protein [bacterium]|jgi:O-antigen ligase
MSPRHVKRNPWQARYAAFLAQLCLLLQIVTTALYYNGYFTNPLINKFLLGQYLALAAWLFFIFDFAFSRRFVPVWSPFYIPAFLLLLWSGISALFAPNADALMNYYIFALILSAFPLWVHYFYEERFRRLYAWAVFFAGFIMVLGVLRQLSTDNPAFGFFRAMTLAPGTYERQRLGSFLGHNKASAAYIWIGCVYAGLLAYYYRQKLWSYLFYVFICLALVLLYLNGSRAEALMIPASLLFLGYGFFSWDRTQQAKHGATADYQTESTGTKNSFVEMLQRNWAVFAILVIAVISLSGWALYRASQADKGENLFSRFTDAQAYFVSGTYPRTWWMSLLMARDNPIQGVGFSAWALRYPDYQEYWFNNHPDTRIGLPELGKYSDRAHNDYLQTWAELGLPGLILMIWLLVIFIRAWGALKHHSAFPCFGIFAGAAVAGTLLRAMGAFPFHEAAASCLFIGNLALLSQQAFPLHWVYNHVPQQKGMYRRRRWLAYAAVPIFLFMSLPICNYIVGDFLAQFHERYAYEAERILRTNPEEYNKYTQYGFESLKRSLKFLPEDGDNLSTLGKEMIHIAIRNKDETMLRQGIEHLEKSFNTYIFYENYAELGTAYRILWKIVHQPEYLEKAEHYYKRSVAVMPVYREGWLQLGVLYGEAGLQDKALDTFTFAMLRFPEFMDEIVVPAAELAYHQGDIILADLIYNLSISVTATSEKLFASVMQFYRDLKRFDLATSHFDSLAVHLRPDFMNQQLNFLLFEMLSHQQTAEAYAFAENLLKKDELQDNSVLWYYAGLTAWLSGQPGASIASWTVSLNKGVELPSLQPAYSSISNLLFSIALY